MLISCNKVIGLFIAAELVMHRDRVCQHCQGILSSLSAFKSRFLSMIEEHDIEVCATIIWLKIWIIILMILNLFRCIIIRSIVAVFLRLQYWQHHLVGNSSFGIWGSRAKPQIDNALYCKTHWYLCQTLLEFWCVFVIPLKIRIKMPLFVMTNGYSTANYHLYIWAFYK